MHPESDIFFEIIKNTRYEDIPRLCQSHPQFAQLCRDPRVLNWIEQLQVERTRRFLDYLNKSGMSLWNLLSLTQLGDSFKHYNREREVVKHENYKKWLIAKEQFNIEYDKVGSEFNNPKRAELLKKSLKFKNILDDFGDFDEQYLLSHPYLISQLVAETRKYPLYNQFRANRHIINFM